MTQINFGVRKDMEIPFGISISIIKVKHWPAYRTKLESADSIFRSADLDVQFLGQVTDRYSSDENNISMEKTPVLTILTGSCKMLIGLQNVVRVSWFYF